MGAVSSNPEACTWSRRPNFVRKGAFLVVERVLKTVPLAQALLSLKPAKTTIHMFSLVVRACGLKYGVVSSNIEACTWSRSPNLMWGKGCGKGLKTVPLAQALLSLKPAQTIIYSKVLSNTPNIIIEINISKFKVAAVMVHFSSWHLEKKFNLAIKGPILITYSEIYI